MTDSRFSFMLGTGRCGSTVLMQALALHRDVGFLSNFDDRVGRPRTVGRANNLAYRTLPKPLQKHGGRRGSTGPGGIAEQLRPFGLTPTEGYRALARDVSPMLVRPCRDLVAADAYPWLVTRLRSFFESHAELQGRPLFVHKFTGWPRSGLLDVAFPESRFIHMVRDGRAVASSLLQQPWWAGWRGPSGLVMGSLDDGELDEWNDAERSFAALAALEWRRLVRSFDLARDEIPSDRWLEVRYEDLVADPLAHLQNVCAHLGLAWSREYERRINNLGISPGRSRAFADELGALELGRVENVLAAELATYHYTS